MLIVVNIFLFFFNCTATTEIYTLSLHDALPICPAMLQTLNILEGFDLKSMGYNSARYIHTLYQAMNLAFADRDLDRKSTRLNSSHANISYAVFCLKKKTRHRPK